MTIVGWTKLEVLSIGLPMMVPFCPFQEGTQTVKVGLIALVNNDGCHVALSIASVSLVNILYY